MQASLKYYGKSTGFRGIAIGKVIHTYPQANMVDVLMFDGSIFQQVQVVSMSASSRGGSTGLTVPIYESDRGTNYIDPAKQTESDVFAIIGFVGLSSQPRPICLGFLFPEENEVLCDRTQAGNEDGTMFLWKHPSNVYIRAAKGKDEEEGKTPEIEISHPSGLFIRIGVRLEDSGIPVLREIINYNNEIRPFKKLNPENDEADLAPEVTLYHPSGTYLTIDKDGNVKVNINGDVTEVIDGDVTRTITGNLTETIEGDLTETVEGDLTETVEGDATLEVQGDKDETVTGAWQRKSSSSIKDEAPTINHN